MASPYQMMGNFGPSSGAPASEIGTPTATHRTTMDRLIPTNVAGIVLVSAGVLVALKALKFNFVVGVGTN